MKIPQILAQTEPGIAPQAHASGDALAAPYAALYRGAQHAEVIAGQLAATGRAMRDQGVKIETNALKTQMETNAKLAVNDLRLVETDPDGYLQKANDLIKGAYQATVDMAKYPETKTNLAQHYLHIQGTVGYDAAVHSRQLYKDRNLGLGDVTLAELRTLGSTAPDQPAASEFGPGEAPGLYSKPKGSVDYYNEGVQVIRDLTPLYPRGEKDAADKLLQWRDDYINDRARVKLRADPMADISKYESVLKPATYERLQTHQDTLRREARVEAEHQEKLVLRGVAHENQNRVGEIEALLVPTTGQPNRARAAELLNFYGPQGVNVMKPADFLRISGMISNPRDFASDPTTKTALIANVYRIDPQWSAATVNALHQAGRLNDADTIAALNHLQTTLNMRNERADNKELTALKYQQTEVHRLGDLLLSTKSPLEAIDPKANALKARYNLEMLNRSKAFGIGNETPKAVMEDVLPGLAKTMKGDLGDYITLLQKQIGTFAYQSRAELKAAAEAGKINRRKFEEQDAVWERLRVSIEQVGVINAQVDELFRAGGSRGR